MRETQSPKDFLKPRWYLNRKQIIQLTGMSRSTLDRLEREGKFPKRVSLSTQRIGWVVQEVVIGIVTGRQRASRQGSACW